MEGKEAVGWLLGERGKQKSDGVGSGKKEETVISGRQKQRESGGETVRLL